MTSYRIEFSDADRRMDFTVWAVPDCNGDGTIEFVHVAEVESITVWLRDHGHPLDLADFNKSDREELVEQYESEIREQLEMALDCKREEANELSETRIGA